MAAWIVVADSYRARIFCAEHSTGPITEIDTLVHTESRLKERELHQGGAGSAFDSGGQGRHRLEPRTTALDHEMNIFAKQIGECLEAGRNAQQFDRLYLMAAPAMLGCVRKHLSVETNKKIIGAIDKEYTSESPEHIRTALPERLWSLVS